MRIPIHKAKGRAVSCDPPGAYLQLFGTCAVISLWQCSIPPKASSAFKVVHTTNVAAMPLRLSSIAVVALLLVLLAAPAQPRPEAGKLDVCFSLPKCVLARHGLGQILLRPLWAPSQASIVRQLISVAHRRWQAAATG